MKTNYLIQILLVSLLALQVCLKSAAQPTPAIIFSASDFSVIGSEQNKTVAMSDSPNFSAAGTASSPLDGSSASGAQTISFGGGTFTGSGRMTTRAGEANNKITEIAAGETSVFIRFQITNSFHFQFVSSVSTVGDMEAEVNFSMTNANGITITNGQITASGTLAPNQYQLHAFSSSGTNNVGGSGTWSYSLALIPADIMPGRFTAAQKATFYAAMSDQLIILDQLFNSADMASTEAQRDELLEAVGHLLVLSGDFREDFLDPLDTNYTVIAPAVAPPVIPFAAGGDITQLEAYNYNAWQTNLSQGVGFSTALTTSINRAQGAAFAGNSYWETAQMNAAVQFEAQLAYAMDQEPALRSNVLAQFLSDGFPAITVTTNDAIALQMEITTNGFPPYLLAGFADLGTDPQTITNLQELVLTSDPIAMAGGFPGSLVNTNLDSDAKAAAAALRDASLMLINTSLLPSGQFRFDLPTEPGYIYTIQFSQNPANPTGWTTLFSNNVTSSLLSFTNTPSASAQAGFYRATHN